MHKIDIAPEILARALFSREGRKLISGQIDPRRTAHLIVDMQNGFMEPGAVLEIPTAREIVPNINRISDAIRAAGGMNVFVQFALDEAGIGGWKSLYGKVLGGDLPARMKETFSKGAHGHAVYTDLVVTPDDLLVSKARFSAFTVGTCDLQAMLREANIDTVIVTGTASNICCESTARDAMQLNYNVVFVSDATAAITDVEHNAALNSLAAIFADVIPTDEVVELIRASGSDADASAA